MVSNIVFGFRRYTVVKKRPEAPTSGLLPSSPKPNPILFLVAMLFLRKKTRFKEDEFYTNMKRSKSHSVTSYITILAFRSSAPAD
jgi:hypothetical protein